MKWNTTIKMAFHRHVFSRDVRTVIFFEVFLLRVVAGGGNNRVIGYSLCTDVNSPALILVVVIRLNGFMLYDISYLFNFFRVESLICFA